MPAITAARLRSLLGRFWWLEMPSPAARSPKISARRAEPSSWQRPVSGACRGGTGVRTSLVWLEQSGLFDVPRQTEPSGRIGARPLVGAVHTISLQSLSAQGVVLLGRFTGVEEGRLTFADDLEANIRFADESSATLKRQIDEYIAREGLDAPLTVDDPAETVAPRLPDPPILSLDPGKLGITTVLWCTGFEGDFSWVQLPGVLDARGRPMHEEGIAAQPGIYFAGLESPNSRRAGTMLGIAGEARRIVKHISQRIHSAPTKAPLRDERQPLRTSKQLVVA
jgi:putative flavoprotein involved in K+ transport